MRRNTISFGRGNILKVIASHGKRMWINLSGLRVWSWTGLPGFGPSCLCIHWGIVWGDTSSRRYSGLALRCHHSAAPQKANFLRDHEAGPRRRLRLASSVRDIVEEGTHISLVQSGVRGEGFLDELTLQKVKTEGFGIQSLKSLVKFGDFYDVPAWVCFDHPDRFYWVVCGRAFQMKGPCACVQVCKEEGSWEDSSFPATWLCGVWLQGAKAGGSSKAEGLWDGGVDRDSRSTGRKVSREQTLPTGGSGTPAASRSFLSLH